MPIVANKKQLVKQQMSDSSQIYLILLLKEHQSAGLFVGDNWRKKSQVVKKVILCSIRREQEA